MDGWTRFRWTYFQDQPEADLEVLEDLDTPPDAARKPYVFGRGAGGYGGAYGGGYGAGGPADPFGRAVQEAAYPPHLYPPPRAYILDLPASRIPQSIAPGASLVLVTWPAIPSGATGVVRKIGLTTSAVADTQITTRINGVPVPPFIQVVGAIGDLVAPQDTQIILRPGDVFDVVAQNTGAGALTAAVRTYGWHWTQ